VQATKGRDQSTGDLVVNTSRFEDGNAQLAPLVRPESGGYREGAIVSDEGEVPAGREAGAGEVLVSNNQEESNREPDTDEVVEAARGEGGHAVRFPQTCEE